MKKIIFSKLLYIFIFLGVLVISFQPNIIYLSAFMPAKIKNKTSSSYNLRASSHYLKIRDFYGDPENLKAFCESSKENRSYIAQALSENDLPSFLLAIPFIKTRFQNASGFENAGVWSFSILTAQLYDLQVDQQLDSRTNLTQSTKAAILYLKDMHDMFQDWNLATLAYEIGEGSVLQAIDKLKTRDADAIEDHFKIDFLQQVHAAQIFLASSPCGL